MDHWRTVATQQRDQLAEKNTKIDQLNAQLNAYGGQNIDLQFKLAEQADELAAARKNGDNADQDRWSKLGLEVQVAHEKINDLQRVNDGLRKRLTASTTAEVQLRNQLKAARAALDAAPKAPGSSDEVLALQSALQRSRGETQTARNDIARLSRQLQAEKEAHAKGQHALEWVRKKLPDSDCDDSEAELRDHHPYSPRRRQRLKQEPKPASAAPAAPFTPTTSARRKSPITTLPLRPSSTAPKPGSAESTPVGKQPPPKPSPISQRKQAPAKSTPAKRKRIGDPADDNDLSMPDYPTPTAPKRPRNRSSLSELDDDDDDPTAAFDFNAVTHWNADGSYDGFDGRADFRDRDGAPTALELREKIQEVQDLWEDASGLYWAYEFTNSGGKKYGGHAQCVTKKLCGGKELSDGVKVGGGRTQWRAGCEGMFACKDCVAREWPCFTWREGEFLLLPLHEGDRKRAVEAGKTEIRYWINL